MLDRSQQPSNPSPVWISEEAWDNITVCVFVRASVCVRVCVCVCVGYCGCLDR